MAAPSAPSRAESSRRDGVARGAALAQAEPLPGVVEEVHRAGVAPERGLGHLERAPHRVLDLDDRRRPPARVAVRRRGSGPGGGETELARALVDLLEPALHRPLLGAPRRADRRREHGVVQHREERHEPGAHDRGGQLARVRAAPVPHEQLQRDGGEHEGEPDPPRHERDEERHHQVDERLQRRVRLAPARALRHRVGGDHEERPELELLAPGRRLAGDRACGPAPDGDGQRRSERPRWRPSAASPARRRRTRRARRGRRSRP